MTTEAETAAPPAELAGNDAIELQLPEGMDGEVLLSTLEAEPGERVEDAEGDEVPPAKPTRARKPAAKVEPTEPKPTEPAVAKEPEAKTREVPVSTREERDKRKEYARLWASTKEQLDSALETIDRLKTGRVVPAALKKHRDDQIAEADKADGMGKVLALAYSEIDRVDRARDEESATIRYELACAKSEITTRMAHRDYDRALDESGLIKAISINPATQTWNDPVIGRQVYLTPEGKLAANPAERLYRLAVGKLVSEGTWKDEAEPESAPAPVAVAPKVAAPSNGADPIVEAERKGRAAVIETVANAGRRPKGIGGLRNAGAPGSVSLTKAQLDTLMERDPSAWNALLQKNPQLERAYLG